MKLMPTLSLSCTPNPAPLRPAASQVCYVLAALAARGDGPARPVHWALLADASRSMRIPIVDEEQFRALVRQGGAQETVVDGVPVWQLGDRVPHDVRQAAGNALDHVARALHAFVERLEPGDRFALVACAEEARVLVGSAPGSAREALVAGIERLPRLDLGVETDLAEGLRLALDELRRGRDPGSAGQVLLLTDGFTRRADACLRLAEEAAGEGVTITTIGLGAEFQDELLTALADRTGGRALFLRRASDVPQTIARELELARAATASAAALRVAPAAGCALRRATRVKPGIATLFETRPGTAGREGEAQTVHLGDLGAAGTAVLLEFVVAAGHTGPLARLEAGAAGVAPVRVMVQTTEGAPGSLPAEVLAAAARASAARMQGRGLEAIGRGAVAEGARLLRAAAERMDELGEQRLAARLRAQADAAEASGRISSLATRELTYATRRLGE